jgi:hypothetical protein
MAPLLHPLTHAPLYPIGLRRDGRPVWPILGGSTPPPNDPPADPPTDPPNDPPADPPVDPPDLGEAGKRALAAERKRAEDAEKRAKKAEADAKKLREQTQSAEEKAINDARDEGATAARAEVMRDRVMDKIEVAAAGRFKHPEDVVDKLGRSADEFIKDGQLDAAAITKAVDKLAEDRPDWLASAAPGRQSGRPPSFDQGGRGSNDKPSAKEQADAQLARRFPTAAK